MVEDAIKRLPFEDLRQANKERRKQEAKEVKVNSELQPDVSNYELQSDVSSYESNIQEYEKERQEYIDALNSAADESTLQKEEQEYLNASTIVEDKAKTLADKWNNTEILKGVESLKTERDSLSQAKEQVTKYNQAMSQKTKLGKTWGELQDASKYDITYNSDGSIQSIKSKPIQYESKIDGKRVTKSSYIPYEITFDSNGNVLTEVERNTYRTTSGNRIKYYGVYDTQSAEYSNGYITSYVDREALGGSKKNIETLSREIYENGIPIKKYQYKYDSKGNRRSELYTDYRSGKVDYDDLGETKVEQLQIKPKEYKVTPVNFTGTANNKLDMLETEEVSSQALRKMGEQEALKNYNLTKEQYEQIVNNPTESKVTFQRQEGGINPVDFKFNKDSALKTELYNSLVTKQNEAVAAQASTDAIMADIKKLNWLADPERLKTLSENKQQMLSGNVSYLDAEEQKKAEALRYESDRPKWIKEVIQTSKEFTYGEFSKEYGGITFTYKPRFFKYAYGIAAETVKDTYDILALGGKGVKYVWNNPVKTAEFIVKSNQAAINFAYKVGQDQIQGIKEKGLIGQYKSNYEFNKNLAIGASVATAALAVSQVRKAKFDKGVGLVSEVGSFIGTSILLDGAVKGVAYGGKAILKYGDDVYQNAKLSYKIAKFNKANKGQIVVYDQVKDLIVRDTGLSTQVAVRPVLSGASKASGITLKEGQTFEQGMIRFKLGGTQYINPNELPKTNAIAIVGKRETVYTSFDDLMKVRPTTLKETPKGFTEIDDVAYFSQKQLPYSKGDIIKSEPIKSVKVTEDVKGIFEQKNFFSQLGKLKQEGDELVFKGFSTYSKEPIKQSIVYGQRGLFNIYPTQAKATVSIFDKSVATVDDAIKPGYWRFWNKQNSIMGEGVKSKNLLNMEYKETVGSFSVNNKVSLLQKVYTLDSIKSPPIFKEFRWTKPEIFSEIKQGAILTSSDAAATTAAIAFTSLPSKKIKKTFSDIVKESNNDILSNGGGRTATILEQPETKKESILSQPETKQETKKIYEVSSGSKTQNIFADKKTKKKSGYGQTEQIYYRPIYDTKPVFKTEQLKKTKKDIISGIKSNSFKTYIGSLYNPKTRSDSAAKYGSLSLFDNKVDVRQDSLIDTGSMLRTDSMMDSRVDTRTDSMVDTKPRYDSKLDMRYDFNYKFDGKTNWENKPNPEEPPKPKLPRLFGGDEVNKKGFNAEVKVGKKWVKVNKNPLPFGSALAEGADVVDNTSARSFRVTKAKSKPEESGTLKQFNSDKFTRKKSGVFIEKSGYAIDTTGELQGITVKGWIANKSKSLFSSFSGKPSKGIFKLNKKIFG